MELPRYLQNQEKYMGILNRNKEMVNIKIYIEITGEMIDAQVFLDDRTSAVKNRLINELKLPKAPGNGQPVNYSLLSKTRGVKMDDDRTLRENGVQFYPGEKNAKGYKSLSGNDLL